MSAGQIESPTAADRMYGRVQEITGSDPLPYGIEANRGVLEELVAHAVDQHILSVAPDVDALFADDTRTLAG